MVAAGRDGHDRLQGVGNGQLTVGRITPGHHGAVGLQGQRVPGSGADLAECAQSLRHGSLPESGVAPGENAAFDAALNVIPAVGPLETVEGLSREGISEAAGPSIGLAMEFF